MDLSIKDYINALEFGAGVFFKHIVRFTILICAVSIVFWGLMVFKLLILDKYILKEIVPIISMIVYLIVMTWVYVNAITIGLKSSIDKPIYFSDFFKFNWSLIIKSIIATIRYQLFIAFGFILLIVPGIYMFSKYFFFLNVLVDKNEDIDSSFKESALLTSKSKSGLTVFFIINMAVYFLVMLPFFYMLKLIPDQTIIRDWIFGVLFLWVYFAIPIIFNLSYVYLYKKLKTKYILSQ